MSYPKNWPKCPVCSKPAMDGHITCGEAACGEADQRDPIFAAMESDEVDPEGDRLLAMIRGSIVRAQRGK